jgi:hypothetical protein
MSLQASSLTYDGSFEHKDQEIWFKNMLIISHSIQNLKKTEVTEIIQVLK